jgi:hypothetical protein
LSRESQRSHGLIAPTVLVSVILVAQPEEPPPAVSVARGASPDKDRTAVWVN